MFSPDQWSYIKGLIKTCLELKDYVPDVPIDTDKYVIHGIDKVIMKIFQSFF